MAESILDYLTRRLIEEKGNWPQISKDSGVEYNTIAKIAQGVRTNPTIANVQPLLNWFEARDEMLRKLRDEQGRVSA